MKGVKYIVLAGLLLSLTGLEARKNNKKMAVEPEIVAEIAAPEIVEEVAVVETGPVDGTCPCGINEPYLEETESKQEMRTRRGGACIKGKTVVETEKVWRIKPHSTSSCRICDDKGCRPCKCGDSVGCGCGRGCKIGCGCRR